MRTLYLDCSSGVSGDMFVAMLLDLGADQNLLVKKLHSLPLSGYSVDVRRVKKSGLEACDFLVKLEEIHDNHDHDDGYLYGHLRPQGHHYRKYHLHGESFLHGESHPHGEPHSHRHRTMKDVLDIINGGDLSANAREMAERIVTILAEAEAKAHGTTKDEVHFHEVGAVDSIVDIAAFAICFDQLGIEEVVIKTLWEGTGTIRCQHGIMPVPVPAVTHIMETYGLPLRILPVEAELVTPTGAAIAAAIRTRGEVGGDFRILRQGMGAGKRDRGLAGILRGMLIEEVGIPAEGDFEHCEFDEVCRLETNIDDSRGEVLGYVMEKLFEEGAREVFYTPVFMKKNRPGYQLTLLCEPKDREKMERIIFEETTTIGIRRTSMERTLLERRVIRIPTDLGEAAVKVCPVAGKKRFYPEYESVRALAKKSGLTYDKAWEMIRKAAEKTEVCR